jgi:HEAT repeat protein
MRGQRQDSVQPKGSDVEGLIGQLNGGEPASGLNAIYELALIGPPAVDPLVKSLLSHVERKLERYKQDKTKRSGELQPREWNEGAFAMQDEAYALGAMGAPAIDALVTLLQHDDPWIKINAAFALGEVGPEASVAMTALAQQLNNEHHQVVRATLDAIACIGVNTRVALPAIRLLLSEDNPDWQEILMRGWTGESQVRFNAMCVLLNSDIPVSEIEELLVDTFDDPNGYVPALAVEALTRDGSAEALRSAIAFLKAHRWDDTLAKELRVF